MLDFYGLREHPFTLLPNPRFMYLSQPYQETKAKLLYFLKDRTASLYRMAQRDRARPRCYA